MISMNFIRSNMKPLMAAMTLMAMITFVFDDSMRAGSSYLIPAIFGLLAGGAAFIWGTRSGKQNEYLAMGAVVGVVVGLVMITFAARERGDVPLVAGLSSQQIGQLKSRRDAANRIVATIYQLTHEVPEDMLKKNPFMAQIANMDAQQVLQSVQFGFGRELDQDVVFGDLLRREAKRLKITVNDTAVVDFTQMIAVYQGRFLQGRRMTRDDFRQLRQQLHLTDHAIYELLREELEARLAAEMTIPRNPVTPQQRWEDFRKVNAKQEIEVATIPVDQFVKGVPEPKDEELTAFFKEHAEKFPSFRGEPGFRQPLRVKLAYLEADYETIDATVTPPTDDEVAKYYEDNKEFYRAPPEKKAEPKDDEPKEGDDAKKDDAKKDEETKDDEKKKDGEKPETSDKPAEPKSEEKPKDEPKPKEADGDKKPDAEKPKSDPQGAAGDDKVAVEKTADEKKETEDKKADAAKPADEPKKDDPNKVDPKEEPKKDDDKPALEKKSADDSKTDKPASEKEKPESNDKPEAGDNEEKPETKPEVRYKSLEEVSGSIHDQLLRQRTLEKMRTLAESAVSEMRDLGSRTIADKKDKSYLSPEIVASKLKDFGKTLNLKYVETTMLSAEELRTSEDFKISSASDPRDESTGRQQVASVIDRVFDRRGDSTHSPEVAEDAGTKNRFAYWIIERSDSHVPKFDESGVRDQVVKAWKLKEAAPKAEARAKMLAKLATEQEKLLTEVLAGQTVNGDKDGLQLTVIAPPEFSHYTRQGASAPQLNPLDTGSQQVELTQIPGLEKISEDFLAAIDRMKVGATEVIPNADRSGYIVVHLKARLDVSADDEAPQSKEFLEKWPFSVAADQLASLASMPLRRDWSESLEKKYNVVWPVK